MEIPAFRRFQDGGVTIKDNTNVVWSWFEPIIQAVCVVTRTAREVDWASPVCPKVIYTVRFVFCFNLMVTLALPPFKIIKCINYFLFYK